MVQTVRGMALRVLFVCAVTRALQCVGGPASRGAAAATVRRGAATGAREAAAADDYASLQRSMERRGAAFTDCRIASCGGSERGVVATAAHAVGSVLIRVPRALAVVPEAALAYASGAEAEARRDELGTTESDLLALWLLEQDATSDFVRSLPTVADLAHLPVFWESVDERADLDRSDVGRALAARVSRDDAFDAALRAASPHYAGLCDRDKWAWAKALVSSRAFSMPGEVRGSIHPSL